MTDRQFDAYQQILLRELERIEEEITQSGVKNQSLERLIQDIQSQLNRP